MPSCTTQRRPTADRIYGSGSLPQVIAFRFEELRLGIIPLLASILPRTLGLFLLGAACGRADLVRTPPAWLAKAAVIALCAGAWLAWLDAGVSVSRGASILLGLGYAGCFLVACERPAFARLVTPLASVGRMALTNYLAQSLLCIALFYGVGLGQMNRLGSAAGLVLAAGLFALQVWASRRWLGRRRFGPVEWAWRRLTYGRLPQT